MEEWQILVLVILFLSALLRSTVGFGDALVAMPLLSLVVDMQFATPLVGLMAITISTVILVRHWRAVQVRSVLKMIGASVVGIPVGILVSKGLHEDVMKGFLGVIIISFSLFKIYNPKLFLLKHDKLVYGFGLAAGVLGGAYNVNGVVAAIYGTLRQWDPEKFRATMQGYLGPTGMMIALGHGIGGLWTREVVWSYLYAAPVILLGIFVGGILNRRIPKGKFDKLIYSVLVILGGALLATWLFHGVK